MLFNKSNNGIEEVRSHISFFYKSNDFLGIKSDIVLAEEELVKTISYEVYIIAQNHYDSSTYNPTGTDIKDKLVQRIQLPVCLLAYFELAQNSDVSHEDTGRVVKIDNEHEKLPFEWMLDRDNDALTKKFNKSVDRLLEFLDKYPTETGWAGTNAQKTAKSLFVSNAVEFDDVYPIDKSRRFYVAAIPFIKDVQLKQIKSMLTATVYETLIAALQSGQLTDPQKEMLTYIRPPLALQAMSIATQRLAVHVLPDGVFQNYQSERLTTKGKIPALTEVRQEISISLREEAKQRFADLQEYLIKLNNPNYASEPVSVLREADKSRKFFRT